MHHQHIALGLLCVAAWPGVLRAQEPATLADLQGLAPALLARAELQTLLTGARMSRVNEKGNTHRWTNEPGGEMVVSSDNRSDGRASTAPARWHIDDQGRFCLTVRWKRGEAEDGCRFVLKTSAGYFVANGLEPATLKVWRLDIGR